MREQIDTIPINDAFLSGDECPFCYLERQAEQRAIRYIAGPEASYMEPDVRAITDSQGFCRQHYKALYDYGNALGNALMLQTYYVGLQKEFKAQLGDFQLPEKKGLLAKRHAQLPITQWAREKESTCYLCSKIAYNMRRYYATFFHLLKEAEFRESVNHSKGFCMHHFRQLMEMAEEFFRAVADNAGMTLHINLRYGKNNHHIAEGIFKAFGHALKDAVALDGNGILSTKGVL